MTFTNPSDGERQALQLNGVPVVMEYQTSSNSWRLVVVADGTLTASIGTGTVVGIGGFGRVVEQASFHVTGTQAGLYTEGIIVDGQAGLRVRVLGIAWSTTNVGHTRFLSGLSGTMIAGPFETVSQGPIVLPQTPTPDGYWFQTALNHNLVIQGREVNYGELAGVVIFTRVA